MVEGYRRLTEARPPNLRGDRDVEYAWVLAHLPPKRVGRALDFGCGHSYLGLAAAVSGFQTTAVDLRKIEWPYVHQNLSFVQGDVRALPLSSKYFDLIINCSSIEHVGLTRYGDTRSVDGDLETMSFLQGLLKPDGTMIVTIPVGRDAVIDGLHRVYGEVRLPRLLSGYAVEQRQFWVKDARNKWVNSTEGIACRTLGTATSYGLGCFVLTQQRST